MRISYNWLQTYFDKPLPPADTLAQALIFGAFEVEDLEVVNSDTVMEVKVLPDRARYALCHRGVAAEVSSLLSIPRSPHSVSAVPVSLTGTPCRVTVKDTDACRRYTARLVERVNVGASPASIVEALSSLGQRSINSVVDAANFVMFAMGQPLHAFDADKVVGPLCVRKALSGERITTLDGKDVALDESVLVIADDSGPLAIAGIKGGKRAEVTATTTRIILESANFHPSSIRKTATRLSIRTDASKRFENDYSPEFALEAIEDFSAHIQKTSPDAVFGPIVDIYTQPIVARTVLLQHRYVQSILGVAISEKEVEEIFARLLFSFKRQSGEACVYEVSIPPHRFDIAIAEDLIEEIGRLYGYHKIPALVPKTGVFGDSDALFTASVEVARFLVASGYSENILHTLTDSGDKEVLCALTGKSFLRTTLLSDLSLSLIRNTRNADILGIDEVKIFEIGNVFPATGESTRVALAVALPRKIKGKTARAILTQTMDDLGKICGGPLSYEIQDLPTGTGTMTEFSLNATALKAGSVPWKSVLAQEGRFKAFSAFPHIVRDIAVFVPAGVLDSQVWAVIEPLAGSYLVTHRLFDVFTKTDADGQQKCSYAFRLVFQAFDRTLTDEELQPLMEKITQALHAKSGWQVR